MVKAIFSSFMMCALLTVAWLGFDAVSPARADTMYNWTFTGIDPLNADGSGTLTVNASNVVTDITGSFDPVTIVSIDTPGSSCFAGCDDKIFPASGPFGLLDSNGLSFHLISGLDLNISGGWTLGLTNGYVAMDSLNPNSCEPSVDCVFGEFAISEVNSTPLPAALPLFAGGLGAMGLLGWRRKRKNTAAIAA